MVTAYSCAKNEHTTLSTSFRWPPAPAKIKIHIPVWTFHSRTDSSCMDIQYIFSLSLRGKRT